MIGTVLWINGSRGNRLGPLAFLQLLFTIIMYGLVAKT